MIVIVGSRYDRVAASWAATWPGAVLCGAEDLTRPGWVWALDPAGTRCWIADGKALPDNEVSAVIVRRSAVYAQELRHVHPDDRAFLAAEAHAFLIYVLGTSQAKVVNTVGDGALGDDALRPEHWMPAAERAGLPVAPLRVSRDRPRDRIEGGFGVDVAGGKIIGEAVAGLHAGIERFAAALELRWARLLFDGRGRLMTITTMHPPTPDSLAALWRALAVEAAQ